MMLFIQFRIQYIYKIYTEPNILPRAYHQSLRRAVSIGWLIHCKRAHRLIGSDAQSESREVLVFYQNPAYLPQTLLAYSIGSVHNDWSTALALDSSQTL